MTKIGFQWYIRYCYEDTIVQERTFDSLEETQDAIASFLKNSEAPLSCCGIDKVEDDDGYIRVLEHIVVPTTRYWGAWEEDE